MFSLPQKTILLACKIVRKIYVKVYTITNFLTGGIHLAHLRANSTFIVFLKIYMASFS